MARGARSDSRADTALAVGCVLASLVLLTLAPARREPIARAIRQTVIAPVLSVQGAFTRAERGRRDADALRRRADSLVQVARGAAGLAEENAQLRALLGLTARVSWGFTAAEALPGPAVGAATTRLLTVGTRDSVLPLSPVVTAAGVAGLVATADATSAVMITWAHPDFRVSATTPDGAASGIVAAHGGAVGGEGMLELRGVPFRTLLAPGTPVLTSGLGGIFPRGVPIGSVVRVLSDEGGWVRSYLVAPAVRPTGATAVMVLRAPRVRAGVDSAWGGR